MKSTKGTIWFVAFASLVVLCLVSVGCRSSRGGSTSGEPLQGTVVDPQQRPIAGVRVEAPGRPAVTTDRAGRFLLRGPVAGDRLPVTFEAPDYVATTRFLAARASRINVIVIWPRAAAQTVDATAGGRVVYQGLSGGVTLPAGGLVDDQGRPAVGPVAARLTYLDVSDPVRRASAPGDFTARFTDGSIRPLESFGIFEIVVRDARGSRLDLAPGRSAEIEIPIPRAYVSRAPEATRLFSFDRPSGLWVEEGRLFRSGLVYRGTIDRFDSSWNADDPLDTTCITIRVTRPFFPGNPVEPNCHVEATGVDYGSVSQGTTNAQGLVCLLVKKAAQVEVQAHSTLVSNYVSVPVILTTPSFPAGAADCGNLTKCPLTEIGLDIITDDGPG